MAVFEEEERRAETEVYSGDSSLGKRALQRVLMRKQLEQMSIDLRELMIYQSPPELGALYTEVEAMMQKMGETQRVLISKQMREDRIAANRRKRLIENTWVQASWGVSAIMLAASIGLMLALVVEDRIKKYPQFGEDWVPKTEHQRYIESLPKKYIGR